MDSTRQKRCCYFRHVRIKDGAGEHSDISTDRVRRIMLKIIALCFLLVYFKASGAVHPACYEPYAPGPCRNYSINYYYDPYNNTCHPFYYGGCGGTRNRFYSWKACMFVCTRRDFSWILKPEYSYEPLEGLYDENK
ncbi:Collagen alpha-3(VI) chain [Echinococcus granulosus]|uniref:Collagen alpha-3(VI) chain n=2 Tax=Echinococcus granulosus TaxID=6210 RepID=W6UGX3_ECHGR|nr:Collagen alpha-3(VI) chain [Echinococcus granulosus]EUB60248.1 Collagen alpha-3(VI) chain [Echinococcus granulosus]